MRRVIALVAIVLLLAAAGASAQTSLLIWADENRANALQQVVPAFTETTGVAVEIEVVGFGEVRNQAGVAGPAGEVFDQLADNPVAQRHIIGGLTRGAVKG